MDYVGPLTKKLNAQRAIPAQEEEVEQRIYRGELCPVVKFNSGPFKNRIYVRYKGSLVHVGDRKMIAKPVDKPEIKQEILAPIKDANGTTKS